MSNKVKHYDKTENAKAKNRQSIAALLIALASTAVIGVFLMFVVFVAIHYYMGKQTVITILSIVGVLFVGFLFAWLNDRSQERANRALLYLSSGLNETIKQQAKTVGQTERTSVQNDGYFVRQKSRVDASRQLAEDRRPSPVYEDGVYEEKEVKLLEVR